MNAGSNTRAALWGKNGSPVNPVHGNGLNAGWGWNNDLSYTDGDTFFLSMDKEAVVEFEILEWHSNCNEWSGTSIEKVDEDTIKVTALDQQKLFLATYDDYVSAGYTTITITATYASGDLWVGNDVWGTGTMFGLASGNSQTLNLAEMGRICLFFNAAMSDVEITYVFGGRPRSKNLIFAGETENYTVTDENGEIIPIGCTTNEGETVTFTVSANDSANTRTFVYYNGELLEGDNGTYSVINYGGATGSIPL